MSNRNFSIMKSNVGSDIQDTSTATATIIGRYINDSYFDVLRRISWKVIDYAYSFNTVVAQQDYILPPDFGKELYLYDSTNKLEIDFIDSQILVKDRASTLNDSDVPTNYFIFDSPVRSQPTSASTLNIVSSDNSDSTQTILIRGISNGVIITETNTLTGTTDFDTTASFTEILSISFSATRSGYVNITSNSAAVTNAIVDGETIDYRVKVLRLYRIPSSVISISMPYEKKALPLINDLDIPLIDYPDVIEQGAKVKAWRYKRQYQKAQEEERVFEKMIANIIWDNENQPNQIHQFPITPYSRDVY